LNKQDLILCNKNNRKINYSNKTFKSKMNFNNKIKNKIKNNTFSKFKWDISINSMNPLNNLTIKIRNTFYDKYMID